jgi:UPF0755 protein
MAYYHSRYSTNGRKKKSKFSRFLYIILVILILAALGIGYQLWVVIMKPNTWTQNDEPAAVFIPTDSSFEEFKTILYSNGLVVNRKTFEWLANKKNLPSHIYPGRYIVASKMNNNELINLFRSGEQVPLQLVLNNIRTNEELASHLAGQLEIDSAEVSQYLTDSTMTKKFGFDPEKVDQFVVIHF